jgi:hypothetical protein
LGVYGTIYRDKKVVGVFVRFSCAASLYGYIKILLSSYELFLISSPLGSSDGILNLEDAGGTEGLKK